MTHTTTSRRRYLAGAASAGTLLTLGVSTASAQAETFELAMTSKGWRGIAPDSIADTINPTLTIEVGKEYAIKWTNRTEGMHNVVIMDEDRSSVIRSDYLSKKGATQTVTFTAAADHTSYFCENHFKEGGEFQVKGGTTTTTESSGGSETTTTTTTTTTTEGSGPGFGVLAGIAGLGSVAAKALYDRD